LTSNNKKSKKPIEKIVDVETGEVITTESDPEPTLPDIDFVSQSLMTLDDLRRLSTQEYLAECSRQYHLPVTQQASLLVSQQTPTPMGVKMAVDAARANLLPLSAIALIPAGNTLKPYVTALGIGIKLQRDPRGIKRIQTTPTVYPTEENGYTCVAHAEIEFMDGSYFDNWSMHSAKSESNKNANADNIFKKCITQAWRRAGLIAIALNLPSAEDYREWRDIDILDPKVIILGQETASTKTNNEYPVSISSFLKKCQEIGIALGDALDILDVDNLKSITDWKSAWDKILTETKKAKENESKTVDGEITEITETTEEAVA
jgi:hypothetical protein